MAEGSLRCDVNVSVHRINEPFGERCELKNISGFSAAVRAVKAESKRQLDLIRQGTEIKRETRRWDDEKGESFISVEDYAMAMVDELEQENHHKERFTIGY